MVAAPNVTVPPDGRLTSQQLLTTPLDGTEVMYIVSPGTAAAGNSYQVTTLFLATYFAALPTINTTVITAGATLADPYDVLVTDSKILFNKTIQSASYAVLPLADSMTYPFEVLFKDIQGDAGTDPITITFTGGELCDGMSEIVIGNPYGWAAITPIPGGGGWYQSR